MLVGQPELVTKLKKFDLRQIYQRIFIKYHLSPLKENEVKGYVEFRLSKAGAQGIDILPECYKAIYNFSCGIPRLINKLCDRVLLFGFVKEARVFTPAMFEECIREIE